MNCIRLREPYFKRVTSYYKDQLSSIGLNVQEDGSIGKTQYYTGFLERTAYYDYNNAESLDELEESGKKRLRELAGYKKLEITDVEGQSLEIGDIVIGRHRTMGITVEKPIIKKIHYRRIWRT